MKQVRNAISNSLDKVGLGELARRCRHELRARGLTHWDPLVPLPELSECFQQTIAALRELSSESYIGDYLEFGVSRGSSMACAFHALRDAGDVKARLFGFDSFAGLPPEAADEGWTPEQYRSTLAATRRYLVSQRVDHKSVILTKGWFKNTLTAERRAQLGIEKAGLIMIDCDLYSASKDALWFCEPLIRDQAAIVFDDWGWRSDAGEVGQKEAFQEFLEAFPDLTADERAGYIPQSRVFLVRRGRQPQ
jgi:O-methyltransferase